MKDIAKELLREFNGNEAAELAAIRSCEQEGNLSLPSDYADFLLHANGGEGFIRDAYLILWRVEELNTLNREYEVSEYAPGLFLFGSNGGGEAFAFDMRSKDKPVVMVPFVGMSIEAVRVIAPDFGGFLQALADSED